MSNSKLLCRACGFHNLEKDCKKASSIAIDIFEAKKTYGEVFTTLTSYNIKPEEPQAFCITCSDTMMGFFWLKMKIDQSQKMLERDGSTDHLTQTSLLEFSSGNTQNGGAKKPSQQISVVEKKIIRVCDRANKYICSPCNQWFTTDAEVRSHATIVHSPINVDNGQKLCQVCLKIVSFYFVFYTKFFIIFFSIYSLEM